MNPVPSLTAHSPAAEQTVARMSPTQPWKRTSLPGVAPAEPTSPGPAHLSPVRTVNRLFVPIVPFTCRAKDIPGETETGRQTDRGREREREKRPQRTQPLQNDETLLPTLPAADQVRHTCLRLHLPYHSDGGRGEFPNCCQSQPNANLLPTPDLAPTLEETHR